MQLKVIETATAENVDNSVGLQLTHVKNLIHKISKEGWRFAFSARLEMRLTTADLEPTLKLT